MKKIAFGRTSDVFEVDGGRVIKLYKPGWPVEEIDRELHFSTVAHAAGLPTPRCFGKESVGDRSGLLFELAEGPTMLSMLQSEPWLIFQLSKQFAELHAKIHSIKIGEGLKLNDDIESRIKNLSGKEQDYSQAALDALKDLPTGNSLLHGDFHPINVIMTRNGPCIVDWMNGSIGSPLADVAQCAIVTRNGKLSKAHGFLLRTFIKFGRFMFVSTYLRNYRNITGVAQKNIDKWCLPLFTARLSLNILGEAEGLKEEIGVAMSQARGTSES